MLEGQVRIPSGCAISGIIDKSGKRMSGEAIIKSITVMHDRSNGLGGLCSLWNLSRVQGLLCSSYIL